MNNLKYLKVFVLFAVSLAMMTSMCSHTVFAADIVHTDEMFFPRGMCYDAKNERIIFADSGANAIFEFDIKSLKLKKIAGKTLGKDLYGMPVGGYRDGKAEEALFKNPSDVTILSSGTIIVADTGNHAIRQISDGRVTTIAGAKEVGLKDGYRQEAQFQFPVGVYAFGDDIYVSDSENNAIRRIMKDGKVVTLKSKVNKPNGIYVDGSGIYVTSMEDHAVYLIKNDKAERFLGGKQGFLNGRSEKAAVSVPSDIFGYKDGFFIADSGNHAVRQVRVTKSGVRGVDTVLGGAVGFKNEESGEWLLDSPKSVYAVNDKLYIADTNNSRILVLDQLKKIQPIYTLETCQDKQSVYIYVDGRKVVPTDAAPKLVEGSTYVPVRLFIENIGGSVEWIESERAVVCKFDGIEFKLKDNLKFFGSRSYIPLRYVIEKLGMKIEWDAKHRAVIIRTY